MNGDAHLLPVVAQLRIAQHGLKEGCAMTSPTQAPVKVPTRRVVMGQITEVEESYAREVGVPPMILFPVFLTALVVDLVGLLLGAILRPPLPTARRPLKSLRKG